jgi:predicted restriction endonuclease
MPRVVVKALSRGQQQPTKRFNNAAARFVLTAFLVLQAAKKYSNVSIEQMGADAAAFAEAECSVQCFNVQSVFDFTRQLLASVKTTIA